MSVSRSVLAGALCVFSLNALAQKVDGTLTVNGKTVKLTHAYATTKPNLFDKKKKVVAVIFTDRELPGDPWKDDFALMEAMSKLHFSGVTAEITDDKQVIGSEIYSPNLKRMDTFSSVGSQKADLTTYSMSHIAGKLYLPEPGDFFDNAYQYSVTFDVPFGGAAGLNRGSGTITTYDVTAKQHVPAGKPLGPDGGEPKKAFDTYYKALMSGNMGQLRSSVDADHAKAMDDPEFKKMLPAIQSMEPKSIKYVNGTIDGGTATLNLSAKSGSETATGTVTMIQEGGKWKLANESWKSKSE